MFVRQISVFVENSFGSAAETLEVLATAQINISALSIADTSDYGIMRLIVDRPDEAKALLKEQGVTVKLTDVLAIPMSNTPGGLAGILGILKAADISVEYMYAFVGSVDKNAVVIAKTDDLAATVKALEEKNITPLAEEEIF